GRFTEDAGAGGPASGVVRRGAGHALSSAVGGRRTRSAAPRARALSCVGHISLPMPDAGSTNATCRQAQAGQGTVVIVVRATGGSSASVARYACAQAEGEMPQDSGARYRLDERGAWTLRVPPYIHTSAFV